jgi:hypothetical protein
MPRTETYHILEQFDVLDVIKIFEFDVLKFQGFIRRIGTSGEIQNDGKPKRTATLTIASFGSYLVETSVGVSLSLWRENLSFFAAAQALADALWKQSESPPSFNELVTAITNTWFSFILQISGSPNFQNYMQAHIDFSTGLPKGEPPGFTKEAFLFRGNEDELTLWSFIQKITESPMNEFFLDEGPRSVSISGNNIQLPESKTYLIGRPTPFDGTVISSIPIDRFKQMPTVPLDFMHLRRYSLSKNMDEVYSMYLTAPAGWDWSKQQVLAAGQAVVDTAAFGKYLHRLCNFPLYYTKVQKSPQAGSPEADRNAAIRLRSQDVSDTLKNWYQRNDSYYSGVITYVVPENASVDPRIGQKLSIEGISGEFYIEGIAHQWNYGGPIMSDASVTRGWNYFKDEPIQLKDRLFQKAKFASRRIM